MDLSPYVAFNAVLDNSTGTPVIRITDVSNYPAGIAAQIAGNITALTEPDGITLGNNNFSTPDISWNGSGLSVASYALRLNTANSFQTGGYSVTYTVRCPGYTDTVLIKTFVLQFKAPVLNIGPNFNNFTPVLTVSDNTIYDQSGLTVVSVADTWQATIHSVNGTNLTISGSGILFDMNYTGLYYDANYEATLTAVISWVLNGTSNWVTLIASYQLTQSFDSEIPPSLTALLASLTFLKAQTDAAMCDCNTYPALLANYLLAVSVYSHLKYRGCNSDFAGLSAYVYQLQKIFNNNVTPAPDHTNLPIPAYDFGCGSSGSISWSSITDKPFTVIIEWTVGQPGYPTNGATSLTDGRLNGYNVLILRNNIQELNYTKPTNSSTITFSNALSTGETFYIQTIPI